MSKLPPGWINTTLVDVIDSLKNGIYKSKEFYCENGIACLRMYNIDQGKLAWFDIKRMRLSNQEREEYALKPRDLLVNRVNSRELVGKACVIPDGIEDCVFESKNIRVRLKSEGVDSKYVNFWFLRSGKSYFSKNAQQTVGMASVSQAQLSRLPIPLAPSNEQSRIVERIEELFSELDAGVAALERAKANLKRYRASVLKAAVDGSLTADWRAKHPEVEPASQLLERILAERRRKWEEEQLAKFEAAEKKPPKDWEKNYKEPSPPVGSELPKIPDGWCWASVQQVGSVQLGRQRSPRHHNGPHMRPYLRVANVFEDRIDVSDVMEMNFTPEEFVTYGLGFGDILLNEGQSLELVGRPAIYRDEIPGACFTNTLVRFRPVAGVNRDFALRVFLAYLKNGRFQKIATITTNIAHLGAGRFAEIEFPLPSVDEQQEIVSEVDRHFSMINAAERLISKSLERAARLRQSILKQAFEGNLVPQNPADEPAEVMLAKIKAQKPEKTPKIAPKPKKRVKLPKQIFQHRASVVSYTVERLAERQTFGRIQLLKTMHLAQCHLGIEMGFTFERYEAGPFDSVIYPLEKVAAKEGWFSTKERKRYGVTYHPGEKINEIRQHAIEFLGEKKAELDQLLDQIAKMNTDEAELFATAYAAWNDLLLDGRPADDDAIIEEIYAWHEKKRKFTPTLIRKRLGWMRKCEYLPLGTGKKTEARNSE